MFTCPGCKASFKQLVGGGAITVKLPRRKRFNVVKGIAATCPNCNAVLGVVPDPYAAYLTDYYARQAK